MSKLLAHRLAKIEHERSPPRVVHPMITLTVRPPTPGDEGDDGPLPPGPVRAPVVIVGAPYAVPRRPKVR